MTDCLRAEMHDLLPDLIHGRLGQAEAARVEAHVASCAKCSAELELLRVVLASAPLAPAMDVNRIARALPVAARRGLVLHQGGGQFDEPSGREPRTVWSRPSVRIAAAVAIVSAGGLSLLVGRDVLNPENTVGQSSPRVAVTTQPAASVIKTASGAHEPAASEVSAGARIASATARGGLSLVGEVQELSDEHLAALITEMDKMNAMLASEPEVISPTIGAPDTSGDIQ